ncbi:MAG: 16S rRNA (cytidine(1402)-2'-O)-methyltransferase [Patescibacteria group bacterium]
MSTLFIVSTPIGNLEDITLRAIRILKEVDLILCEDTRETKKLLDKYEISKQLLSYNAHATDARHTEVIELLREGKNIALVSDAGTPTISDPGSMIVARAREALGDELSIVPIPGPSALLSALAASGFPASDFLFLGFLPHKKGRETLFKEIAASERTVVFYESPHRFEKALLQLSAVAVGRRICVARELTKLFEEVKVGTVEEISAYYTENPDKMRGEFVVVVSSI